MNHAMPIAIRNGPMTTEFLLMRSIASTAMPPTTKPSEMIQSMSGKSRYSHSSQPSPTTISVTGSEASLMVSSAARSIRGRGRCLRIGVMSACGDPLAEMLEVVIDDRRDEERQQLRYDEPADDGQPERTPGAAARAECKRNRQAAHERGHRRHHDRTEARHAGLEDRLFRRQVLMTLRFDR